MGKLKAKTAALTRRHRRVRGKVSGTAERPRLVVTRTNTNIYAQLVDDVSGRTLVSASTIDPEVRPSAKAGGNIGAAKLVGEAIGKRAVAVGIMVGVFDRGGRLYHGRVRALANAARDVGLKL
jgi:large subunit ribosomal protein L18